MNEHVKESRHLPAAHVRRLEEVEEAPKIFDGRSLKWVERLAEADFIQFNVTKDTRCPDEQSAIFRRRTCRIHRKRQAGG